VILRDFCCSNIHFHLEGAMSELEDIAAGIGIAIVDNVGDNDPISLTNPDTNINHSERVDPVESVQNNDAELLTEKELEELLSNRYSESDTDYIENLQQAESVNTPPYVQDFNCRPPRNDNRNDNRNNRREGQYGDRGRRGGWGSGGRGGWNGGDERGHGYNSGWRGKEGSFYNNDRRPYGGRDSDREDNRYNPYRRNDRNRDWPPYR